MVSRVGAYMQQTPAVEQAFARSMISRWGAIWKSGSRRFHQAGHVLPELTQRIFPKGVVAAVEHHVPVGRRGYRHAAECEVAAQLVERRGGSCTPKRRHCTCRLADKLPPAHARSVEYAVKQREQRTVWG